MMVRRAARRCGVPGLCGLVCALSLCFPLLAGCGGLELKSHWMDRDVVIDGVDNPESEWRDARTYLEDEDVAVGLLNDDEYLCVSLVTSDRMKGAHIMGAGLTLWLTPGGGKEKAFGIRFPIGREGGGPPMDPSTRQDPEQMERNVESLVGTMKEMEILGPGENEIRRVAIGEGQGTEVKLGVSRGSLVYELKVPLVASAEHPYAIAAEKVQSVGICFETPEADIDQMRGRMGGRGGGMGGPGGGMGPRGGGRGGPGMRGERPGMPEPLEFRVLAELASQAEPVAGREK